MSWRRWSWTLGLTGAAMAVGFLVRVTLRGHVDERSWWLAIGGACLLLIWSFIGDRTGEDRGWRRAGGSSGLLLLALLASGLAVEGVRSVDRVFDLASEGLHPLSEVTRARLQSLDEPLTITAVFRHGSPSQQAMRRRLDPWDAASPQVEIVWLDPLRSPLEAQRLGVAQEEGELLLRLGDRQSRLVGRLDEAAMDAALARLMSDHPRVACWITDHGEPDPDDLHTPEGFGRAVLEAEAYAWTFQPTRLSEGIPSACDLLVMVAPEAPIPTEHQERLRRAVDDGVGWLVLVEPDAAPGLEQPLAQHGVELLDGVVLAGTDAGIRLGSRDPALLALASDPVSRPHPLSAGLRGAVILAIARPVQPHATAEHARALLAVPDAQGIVSLDDAEALPRRSGEVIPVGAIVEPPGLGRVIVIGDTNFATNRALEIGAHRQLWLDALGWIAGEPILGTRPGSRVDPLELTLQQGLQIAGLVLFGVPGGLIAVAVGLWWHRRRL